MSTTIPSPISQSEYRQQLADLHQGAQSVITLITEQRRRPWRTIYHAIEAACIADNIELIAGQEWGDEESAHLLNIGDVLFWFFALIERACPTVAECAFVRFALDQQHWRSVDELEVLLLEEHGPLHTHLLRWLTDDLDRVQREAISAVFVGLVQALHEEVDSDILGEEEDWILSPQALIEILVALEPYCTSRFLLAGRTTQAEEVVLGILNLPHGIGRVARAQIQTESHTTLEEV